MSDEFDTFLKEVGLRKRLDCFRAGPETIEHAAACGLFAVAAPPEFGGIPNVSGNVWSSVYAAVKDRQISRALNMHYIACNRLAGYGSPQQHAAIFPALASGKQIGILAEMYWPASIGATDDGNGYVLHGHTVAYSKPTPTDLLAVGVAFARVYWLALIEYDALPAGRELRHGRVFLDLRDVRIPYDALLQSRLL